MASGAIRIDIADSIRSFRFEEANVRGLLNSREGAVGRDLVRRAIRVDAAAKQNASHEPPSVPGEGPAVRTGRLRGSITYRLGIDARSMYADVGSAVLYAPYVELGTSRMAARPFLRPALAAARI